MDLIRGGDLFNHLKKMKRFSEQQTRFLIACVVTSLGYLHNRDIIYRDLKPENILLDHRGFAYLCDFGLAKFLNEEEQANTFCGTPEYLAPERILDRGCSRSGDWWSLGILTYELLFGSPPFYSKDKKIMYQKTILEKLNFSDNITVSEDAKDFIKKLLTKSPKNRLGNQGDALDIMNHPFLSDFDWSGLLTKTIKPCYNPIKDVDDWLENFDV